MKPTTNTQIHFREFSINRNVFYDQQLRFIKKKEIEKHLFRKLTLVSDLSEGISFTFFYPQVQASSGLKAPEDNMPKETLSQFESEKYLISKRIKQR
ncbi:CLUMA_CG016860, isoform A [Clunio marinus]|uniref:CLUMA_CG016860, isoform A n=1 Tax=Clunio marinus TaxID=568069 RepID=A0A1J1IU90_9DIPT|nr:CLUMA_CG016860, isoform A [Clunio marinus]